MILLNLNQLHTTPQPDPVSTIVYAAEASDVATVIIDGRIVMRERQLLTLDEQATIRHANEQAGLLRGLIPDHG
jgi:5-methylthioadenosine/S-adenosylhomocysteine deaminase